MTADKAPSLTILGVYSYSADKVAYARFIRELIDSFDPPNFSEEVKSIPTTTQRWRGTRCS